ncbi:MAG TPA: allantoicase [Thermoanaerobaculia bacterium]|nr:allantoicase [Thermoanaerobaculia bacterium]
MSDFRDLFDLASERLGGTALYANDEFFADKENLLKPGKPVWKEHEYTDRGKWMDGWESRRKRTPGHDFCIVRLGLPGVLHGVVVDTSYFRGNFPDGFSIEACHASQDADVDALLSSDRKWVEILGKSKLAGDCENIFPISHPLAFTHVRFNIFPDGGVARLRLHGRVIPEWKRAGGLTNEIDLASVENGAEALTCSDMFFGSRQNLIMPGRAGNMSDGWETKRRRGPGYDWVIVKLAAEGIVRRIEIDTNHFKGNYPDAASIEGCRIEADSSPESAEWTDVLPRTKLQAHTRHLFNEELVQRGPWTHLRLNVYPDGGVSRLRVHGLATEEARHKAVVERINTAAEVGELLEACCAAKAWVRAVAEQRPYASWDQLVDRADREWSTLPQRDWLEAFRAHPRIGERKAPAAQSAVAASWSGQEQASAGAASDEVMAQLTEANREYEAKFGRTFIVCATGRSAGEILANARQRMSNSAEDELHVAAEEQRKITRLRLEKLVTV